ncbi:MAG: glycoside hydrolase [Porphyromonadaceae bacterium]|nr:glycoside hydrolase [Porphyromonadaceae bacterium]
MINLKVFFTSILSLTFYPFLIIGQQQKAATSDDAIKVDINLNNKMQAIEGWGSSLCWWAGQIGSWEESKADSIVDLITSPDKLNMNIFRYNIGGGDDPSHIGGHMAKGTIGKRAEMEGFKSSENAPYDWTADEAQRNIMLKIKQKRPDAIFEAFSNSPPYWMTYSGCSSGNMDPEVDNLKPEYYDAFCNYLIDVCKHYKDTYGIEFKTLEPFNESTSSNWKYLGRQEGCHFDPETQIKIIRLLYPKLKKSGLKTVISASDEASLEKFIIALKAYQHTGDIFDKLGQLNTHTYAGTNDQRKEVHQIIKTVDKEFWQSETGTGSLRNRSTGLKNNLLLAQRMFDDLNLMQPQAWLDWQISENSDIWALIKADFTKKKFTIIKNMFVRMQVTRFVKQGYSLLETGSRSALVAIDKENKKLVVVLNNPEENKRDFLVDLASVGTPDKPVEVYRTSANEDCKYLPTTNVVRGKIAYSAPALSLTTFLISID